MLLGLDAVEGRREGQVHVGDRPDRERDRHDRERAQQRVEQSRARLEMQNAEEEGGGETPNLKGRWKGMNDRVETERGRGRKETWMSGR